MIRIDPEELAALAVEQAVYIRRLEHKVEELLAAQEEQDADAAA